MEANEAPKKIYLYPSDRAGEEYEDEWGTFPWGEDYVEYTRTDAFIEKAERYLQEHLIDYWSQSVTDENKFIEDFKKYMKGELQ